MTVDREELRELIRDWKPGMTVEIQVSVLKSLLDELDDLCAIGREVDKTEWVKASLIAGAKRVKEGKTR